MPDKEPNILVIWGDDINAAVERLESFLASRGG